jgi:tripartite-type tricarboxylate transporter receptor subunit TctC
LHDAFKKTLTDPAVIAVFAQFDQPIIEMNTEQYTKYAMQTYAAERKTIERLGMLNKD